MPLQVVNPTAADIDQAIVQTVSYVDSFDYPLTPPEIHRYLVHLPLPAQTVTAALNDPDRFTGRLTARDGYYMLPGREAIVETRRARGAVAARLWPSAIRYGLVMARLPFVRMVAVTGSLSVNNVGAAEDIDYLIVTAADHLWVCRAFVIALVRYAARQGIDLCPNYFLSARALAFSERNLYTAHEVTQMVPIHGMTVYHTLRHVNSWTREFLPNASGPPEPHPAARAALRELGRAPVRDLLEAVLQTRPAQWLDEWEMSRKIRKFQLAYSGWQESDFTTDICKGHFNLHQQRAIRAYEQLLGDRPGEREASQSR